MAIGSWTLREKAEIVKMFLPDHTLDIQGKVVEAPECPLCEKPMDRWTTTHSVKMNGEWVKVHSLCPSERGD